MSRHCTIVRQIGTAVLISLTGVMGFAATLIAQAPLLKYHDGQPDGKKSLGGLGELLRFTLPDAAGKLEGLKIHGSRYGLPEAPKESFLIYVLNQDQTEIIATEMAPYGLFERGAEKWVDVKFRKPVDVPQEFWVALDFRAGRTKGVYVSFDSSTDGSRSQIGLPGLEGKPVDFAGDWMIEATLSMATSATNK